MVLEEVKTVIVMAINTTKVATITAKGPLFILIVILLDVLGIMAYISPFTKRTAFQEELKYLFTHQLLYVINVSFTGFQQVDHKVSKRHVYFKKIRFQSL